MTGRSVTQNNFTTIRTYMVDLDVRWISVSQTSIQLQPEGQGTKLTQLGDYLRDV